MSCAAHRLAGGVCDGLNFTSYFLQKSTKRLQVINQAIVFVKKNYYKSLRVVANFGTVFFFDIIALRFAFIFRFARKLYPKVNILHKFSQLILLPKSCAVEVLIMHNKNYYFLCQLVVFDFELG